MSWHKEQWEDLANKAVDWANEHPGYIQGVSLFLLGFILGVIV